MKQKSDAALETWAKREALAEEIHQRAALPQEPERLGQRPRQLERQIVRASRDRLGGLQPLDHAEVAAGERSGHRQVRIGVGTAAAVLDPSRGRQLYLELVRNSGHHVRRPFPDPPPPQLVRQQSFARGRSGPRVLVLRDSGL